MKEIENPEALIENLLRKYEMNKNGVRWRIRMLSSRGCNVEFNTVARGCRGVDPLRKAAPHILFIETGSSNGERYHAAAGSLA